MRTRKLTDDELEIFEAHQQDVLDELQKLKKQLEACNTATSVLCLPRGGWPDAWEFSDVIEDCILDWQSAVEDYEYEEAEESDLYED